MQKAIYLITLSVILIFMAVLAFGQTWHTTNQATIAWDAVTTNFGGDPLPSGDTVEYKVYLANAVTDPDKTSPTEVARVAALENTITLNVEGRFWVGVRAVRTEQTTETELESVIAWSDNPAYVANGETFGLQHFLPPATPGGMRPQ